MIYKKNEKTHSLRVIYNTIFVTFNRDHSVEKLSDLGISTKSKKVHKKT